MAVTGQITLLITIISTILLAGGWIRPDLTAILTLVVLAIAKLVTPEQALAGFSGSAVITILAISIIAEGLHNTGISHKLGQIMKKLAGVNENQLIIVITLSGAILSLFMNNIAAMAILLPATMSLSRQTRVPPSRLLMPLAFGVIAGGMATLFTTSNIIASSALKDAGFMPFNVLDFLPIGIPIIIVTILYMRFIGKNLLPKIQPANQVKNNHLMRDELLKIYGINSSLWEVSVRRGSPLAGISITEGAWRTKFRLNVIGITRNGSFISAPSSDMVINEGDNLLTQGEPDEKFLDSQGISLIEERPIIENISNGESTIAEIALAPHSKFVGKTLREIHFREKYRLTVLALWRSGKPVHIGFASMKLKVGDGLLIRGSAYNLRILNQERDFIFLEEDPESINNPEKARMAGAIGLITIALAIAGFFPISIISLCGAAAMILTGCLNMDEAYSAIDWKAIFLIAGIWPLSTAIMSSGLNNELVASLLQFTKTASPVILVALLLFVTMILTNIMAGQAATPVILAPIGLAISKSTGLDPRMLLMVIALGCSLAFPTPIGHPVNIIVMGSGGYSYKDFLRTGSILTFIIFLFILIGLNFFWGL